MEENKEHAGIRQAYLELQVVNQQIKQNQQQAQAVEEQINELNAALDNLDDLKSAKKGSKMLVPLTQGIFVKASLMDNSELVVNVGAGTSVKKNIDETKWLLEEQLTNIKEIKKQIISGIDHLIARATSIEKGMEQLATKKSK